MTKQKELLSVHEIWQHNYIYWIKTYKTLLKYISKDYVDIFKPILKAGKGRSGKRYYVARENLDNFIKKFENNELS